MGCSGCDWDPDKEIVNLRKHGIAFEEARCVFHDPFQISLPDDRDYGEERWLVIGRFESRVLVVVFTVRNDAVPLISARRAKKGEEVLCFGQLG